MDSDNVQYKGKVAYNKDIVKSIINLATKEINGVSNVDKPACKICKLISTVENGVKVKEEKDGITIDVYVQIYSNSQVSEIAWRIQENVKTAVQSMMDIKVKSVNVNVVGVDFSNIEANV